MNWKDPSEVFVAAVTGALIIGAIVLGWVATAKADTKRPDPPKNLRVFQCPLPDAKPQQIIAAGYDVQLRIVWYLYSTKGTQQPDYFAEYEITKVTIDDQGPLITKRPFPTRHFVDTDGDGYFDKFYYDAMGNGKCEDIREFQPSTKEPKGMTR